MPFSVFLFMNLMSHYAPADGDQGWSTAYERSGYVSTGDYDEAVAYCQRLASASPFARVIKYGKSPQGRDMIALLVSGEKAFSPSAMSKSRRPLVFVQNGIHAGEIEGKDASLVLLRDMLVDHRRDDLLRGANYLFVPIYNVDGHERRSPYNRINQNGPANMGFRGTGQNYNLNRDYMKLDAPESWAQVALLHRYKPDFFFDNHTTDGADYPYSVMLCTPNGANLPSSMATWQRSLYNGVKAGCDKDGFLTAPYFELDESNPARGITVDDFGPRYSNGYLTLMNRPSMLVETHMLKPYRHRVDATYSVMLHTIQRCIADAPALKAMNRQADADEAAGRAINVLDTQLTAEKKPFTFIGWTRTPFKSEITGSMVPHWDHVRIEIPTTIRDVYESSLTVTLPAAYAIPPEWTEVIEKLRLHGLQMTVLKKPLSGNFDGYRFSGVKYATNPFEGRFQPSFTLQTVSESRDLPAGTVIVPLNQVGAKLAMALLEPAAPDSLVKWGLFNNIFEQKEYFETYSMEAVAADMLRKDPSLKTAFEEKLKDPAFASNPRARLQFFFERSPYLDSFLNRYPVVRLNPRQLSTIPR